MNKKVGNAANARHVDFPKFGERARRGAPMVVDIGGVGQGVSEQYDWWDCTGVNNAVSC